MIELKNLSFSYPNKTILKDVNLKINKGEFVSIIGENGSGKSTLMNLMLGLLKPTTGQMMLLGQDAVNFNDFHKIGVISQSGLQKFSAFPATALELVMAKHKRMNKAAKKAALASLDHVGMLEYADHMLSELSGGQLQRVLIAREVMFEPEILFLDEPSSALDKKSVENLLELLEHFHTVHQMTIVMITHHYDELSSRVLEVKDNQIIERVREDVSI